MNWNFDQHKQYEQEQIRKAEKQRIAQEAKEDNFMKRRRSR